MKTGVIHGHEIKNLSVLLLFGILLIIFGYFTFLLDAGLNGRYVLAGLITLIAGLFAFQMLSATKFYIDHVVFAYTSYLIINICSITWAFLPSESVYETSKVLLGFVFFLFINILMKNNRGFLLYLTYTLILVLIIYLIIVIVQLSALEGSYSRYEMYKVTGLNGNKNQLSIFLFLVSSLILAGLGELRRGMKFLALLTIGVSLFFLLFLSTRSVYVGILTTTISSILIFMFTVKFHDKFKFIFFLFLAFTITILFFTFKSTPTELPQNLIDPLALFNDTVEERLLLWQKSLDMFKDNPLLGVGAGNWRIHFPNYTFSGFMLDTHLGLRTPQRPHNDFIWILTELGLLGLLTYLTFFIILFWWSLKKLTKQIIGNENRKDVILIASVLGYLAISFFTFPKERIEHVILFNIMVGLLYSSVKKK